MNRPVPQNLAERFALIASGLRELLAARMHRQADLRPVLMLIWTRIGRLNQLVELLSRRLAEGRLPARPATRSTRRGAADGRCEAGATPKNLPDGAEERAGGRPRQPDAVRVPGQKGWLVAKAIETVSYGEYLRLIVQEPEMIALLDAAPRLKPKLRSLLRLLGAEIPAVLALPPPSPRPPRLPRLARPRPSGARPARPAPTTLKWPWDTPAPKWFVETASTYDSFLQLSRA